MNDQRPLPVWQQTVLHKCGHASAKWTRVDKEAMVHQPIFALFEAQVARDPHRLAVKSAAVQSNYGELNRAANRVARSILTEQQDRTMR